MTTGSLLALALAVSVGGGSDCPAPGAVEARLAPLLPHDQEGAPEHAATVERQGDEVAVQLRARDGELLASKKLQLAAQSCLGRARTVAVLLAAWELRLRGQGPELLLPAPPAPPPPPPPPPPAMIVAKPAPPPPAPPAPGRLALEIGAGGLASIVAGQPAFGGLVTALLGPREGLWVVAADLEGIGNHSMPYGNGSAGSAQWNRFVLGLGPGLRLRWRRLTVEGHVMASASWLQLQGSGFSSDQRGGDLDVSVGAGLRVAASFGKLHPWVGVRLDAWLRGESVQVVGLSGPAPLPNLEVLPALGCDLDVF